MSESVNLPNGWAATSLEKVVVIRDDARCPVNAEERAKRVGPYPYYGATGQAGCIDDYLLDGEYVLLGEDGAPFLDPHKEKAYIVRGKFWVNNHAHVLQGAAGLMDNRLLCYALNALDYRGFANGTTRLKLTQGAMRRLPIRLPPVNEQCRIAAKLDELLSKLDAGVAALERAKAGLKRYRAAVLKAAVEGRLTQEWRAKHRDAEPASILLRRILNERRRRWEVDQLAKFKAAGKEPPNGWQARYVEPPGPDTSSLPELPTGWCWATVEQSAVATLIGLDRGRPNQRRDPVGSAYVKMNNITFDGRVLFEDLVYVETAEEERRRYFLTDGDLLFNTRNSKELVGKVGLVRNPPGDAVFNNNLMRLRLVTGEVDPAFACQQMCSEAFRRRMEFIKKGTTNVAAVYAGDLLSLPLAVPSTREQTAIVEIVERSQSTTFAIETEIEADLLRAARLRQAILKRAFEGKLVPQDPADEPAERLLERVRAERAAAEPDGNGRAKRSTRREGAAV